MTTYQVHIKVANLFEDVYVEARNETAAIRAARKQSTFPAHLLRWASFIT